MIRAMDPIGQTVDYVQATHYSVDANTGEVTIHAAGEIVAVVPGDWLVKEMPATEVDPGVEGAV